MKFCNFLFRTLLFCLCIFVFSVALRAQDVQEVTIKQAAPLTRDEFVQLVFQLQKHPERREQVAGEIRKRGLGFPLNDGLRSFVASKSGNDEIVRRTIEEAERRRINPSAAKPPTEREASDVLAHAKTEIAVAAETMPDFVVKQIIGRAYALGTSRNWITQDHLTVAVSYRAQGESHGEKYKLLAINGIPQTSAKSVNPQEDTGGYEQAGGTRSMGEYVSWLAELFNTETHADFRAVDTDTLGNRRAIVYEFAVQKENSKQSIKFDKLPPVIAAYHGRLWIDRENFRVLRFENISNDIPPYPVTATSSTIDYDWVTIAGKKYLLPSHADIQLTAVQRNQTYQTRNDIRFRNYQKYGTEVRIIEDDAEIVDQPPPEKKP